MNELPELLERLQEDAGAIAVLVLAGEGDLLGWAGELAALPDGTVDAVADLFAARSPAEGDDLVAEIGAQKACATSLAGRAVLIVVFDEGSTLPHVQARIKSARSRIVRSLDARHS
jgi:hypothetical protein